MRFFLRGFLLLRSAAFPSLYRIFAGLFCAAERPRKLRIVRRDRGGPVLLHCNTDFQAIRFFAGLFCAAEKTMQEKRQPGRDALSKCAGGAFVAKAGSDL